MLSDHNHGTIDSSCIESSYANVFEVFSSYGEIVIAFGSSVAFDKDLGRLSALLTNRIIVSPFIAKQLVSLLNIKICEYEAVFGSLTKEVQRVSLQDTTSLLKDIPCYLSEQTAKKAIFLMKLIDGLDTEYALERSFKISNQSLLTNRFIMGFKKDILPQNPNKTIISLFNQMGMPERFITDCSELLPKAEFIHFGFEEQHDSCMYKAYLEFKTTLKFAADGTKVVQDPYLVFLGYKWNPYDNSKCAVTRYTCYPMLSMAEIEEKLSCLYEGNPQHRSLETVKDILNNTVKIISNNKIIYEEVTEENNPRKSFDMNLYAAGLRIRDIYSYLTDIAGHYAIPADKFMPFCDGIMDKQFGHLSGGIDRAGRDFLTVYYGVEGIDNRRRRHPVRQV